MSYARPQSSHRHPRWLVATAIALFASGSALPADTAARRVTPRLAPLTVQALQRTNVYAAPSRRAPRMGQIVRGTRLPLIRQVSAGGCRGGVWYEVARGAWACAAYFRRSWRLPSGRLQPPLRPGRLVPRIVYYARRDGVPIYKSTEHARRRDHDRMVEQGFSFSILSTQKQIAGRRFILTRRRELVPRSEMRRYHPSPFRGRNLAVRGRPERAGWIIHYRRAVVRAAPGRRARRVDHALRHTWITIHEARDLDGQRWLRIGEGRWVRGRDVTELRFSAPPPGVHPGQRWVEVLLDRQTLVAYEGIKPVYATLVSTGRPRHRTPQGIFRVRTKVAMTTMNNRPGAGERYNVDDVPWVMFFHGGYALHGTYWHNGFGRRRSHGCINLSPTDAKWLFDWAPPRLRPGWWTLHTGPRQPGMILRIRRRADQVVRYRGPRTQPLRGDRSPPPRHGGGHTG